MSLCVRSCGHTRNDLPFVVGVAQPCVDHAKAAGLLRTALVDPRQANAIGDGDVFTGRLRREALQIIGFESFTEAGVCGYPVRDGSLCTGSGLANGQPRKSLFHRAR